MCVFLNPETREVVVCDSIIQAFLQASLVNQRFIVAFDEDEPYIMELDVKEEYDNEA